MRGGQRFSLMKGRFLADLEKELSTPFKFGAARASVGSDHDRRTVQALPIA